MLDAGYPVIVDAAFLKRWQRDAFRRLAAERAIPFCVLDFRAERSILDDRLMRRVREGADASEATAAVLEHQVADREALQPDELEAVIGIDTQRQPPEAIAQVVRGKLARLQR